MDDNLVAKESTDDYVTTSEQLEENNSSWNDVDVEKILVVAVDSDIEYADIGLSYDSDTVSEVHHDTFENVFAHGIPSHEPLESIQDTYVVNENNSNIISNIPNMDPDRGKDQHEDVDYEQQRALFSSLINNLKCDVENCNEVNREAQKANALLTNELERYKEKDKHFAKDKTIESEYCKKIKLLNDKISNLKSQACQTDKTFAKENGKYNDWFKRSSTNARTGKICSVAITFHKIYVDTRSNSEASKKCILQGPYKLSHIIILGQPTTAESLEVLERTAVEAHYDAEKEAIRLLLTGIGDEIYSNVDACKTTHDMWIAKGNNRFYKMMNEMVRNQLEVTTMQVNVQFLQPLQPEWSRFVTIIKKTIAKNANPLALVALAQQYPDSYYQAPKPHKSYALPSKQSSSTRSHATTRHKGKEIAKPITPPSESASEEDSDPKQAQRDKDINKNVDTSPKYKNDNQNGQFGNQRTVTVAGARETVGSQECRKPKWAKDYTYHKEKMLLCKQAGKGVSLQAEQADWREDMDEEIDEQELEAHYSFMAKIQEVLPAESGYDAEPLEKIVQLILFIVDSGCTKHMTGNLKLLCNFIEKYLGTVRFVNDQFAPILGYGDLVQGNIMIKRFYYAEGLNHNIFLVGQFCDAELEDQLCSSCELSKAKRSTFKTKVVPSSKGRLNLLHMDLCGPMRIKSINEKKYILVIVNDYSRYTWTHFRRTKDETPESKGYRVYNKRTRLIVESTHINFDEIKELSKASDYDNSCLVPQLQKTSDHNCSELSIHDHNNEPSSSTLAIKVCQRLPLSLSDNSKQQDTQPTVNIQPTTELITPTTNVNAEENNND
ncbi:retrovirus-related pol polyprotein from transposon TNT 1-94 [Tanacetum coccineum]